MNELSISQSINPSIHREAIREDEQGSLQATVDDIIQRVKRKRLLEKPTNVRLGMVNLISYPSADHLITLSILL